MKHDFAALLAERFLIGEIEFSPRTEPPFDLEWRFKPKDSPIPRIKEGSRMCVVTAARMRLKHLKVSVKYPCDLNLDSWLDGDR